MKEYIAEERMLIRMADKEKKKKAEELKEEIKEEAVSPGCTGFCA